MCPAGSRDTGGVATRTRVPDALEAVKTRPAARNIVRKVLLGLVLITGIMWIATMRRPPAPALEADCGKAAFRLSADTVKQATPLTYSMSGAAGREYALAVDTTSFTGSPGAWQPVPRPGHDADVVLAAPPGPMPDGCLRTGIFSLPVSLGTHTVTLFELTPAGPLFVAQQDLQVTED